MRVRKTNRLLGPLKAGVVLCAMCKIHLLAMCVTIMGAQSQRHTRNQQKSSGDDIYGLIGLNYYEA